MPTSCASFLTSHASTGLPGRAAVGCYEAEFVRYVPIPANCIHGCSSQAATVNPRPLVGPTASGRSYRAPVEYDGSETG